MKIWLDDYRTPPDETWTWTKTFREFMNLWERHRTEVTHIGFDHDLGSKDPQEDGYQCATYVEEALYSKMIDTPPIMTIQSDNGPGRRRLQQVIDSINNMHTRGF